MRAPRGSRAVAGVLSGTGAWLMPVGICPACWPAYAGIVSSFGLGFTLSAEFLVPVVMFLLAVSIFALGYRAERRRGLGPLGLGVVGGLGVLAAKLWFSSEGLSHAALGTIVIAGFWNSWPSKRLPASRTGSCPTAEE